MRQLFKTVVQEIGLIDVALAVCIVRLMLPIGPTLFDVGILFVVMLGFMHERYEENKSIVVRDLLDAQETRFQKQVEDYGKLFEIHTDEIHRLKNRIDAFRETQDQLTRSAEDIKKVISTQNLRSAIYTRVRPKENT